MIHHDLNNVDMIQEVDRPQSGATISFLRRLGDFVIGVFLDSHGHLLQQYLTTIVGDMLLLLK
jgi:hypothetical protein